MKPRTRLGLEPLDDRIVPAKLSVGDTTVVEGNSGTQYAQVAVRLSSPASKTVTVNYATGDGTAAAGSDYSAVSGQLTFTRGQTAKTIQVPVHGDRLAELSEYFRVSLSGAKNATIGDGIGIVNITEDEPRVNIERTEPWFMETFCTSFRVILSNAYDQPVTVDFEAANGTAAVTPLSGTLTFAPGETEKVITVEYSGPQTYLHYFYGFLSNPSTNAMLGSSYAIGGFGDDGGSYDPGGWPAP